MLPQGQQEVTHSPEIQLARPECGEEQVKEGQICQAW